MTLTGIKCEEASQQIAPMYSDDEENRWSRNRKWVSSSLYAWKTEDGYVDVERNLHHISSVMTVKIFRLTSTQSTTVFLHQLRPAGHRRYR
jgi:hypothetical protein